MSTGVPPVITPDVQEWFNQAMVQERARMQSDIHLQVEALVQARMEAMTTDARMPKPPHPEYYKGDRDAMKINTWIDQAYRYGAHFRMTEAQMVATAVFYLTGMARDWWTNMDAGGKARMGSWEHFTKDLRAAFYPIDHERRVLDQIEKLTQKGSVSAYVEKFEAMRTQVPGVSDRHWKRSFLNGLHPSLKVAAVTYDMDNPQATLAQLYRRLTAIGDVMWDARAERTNDNMDLSQMDPRRGRVQSSGKAGRSKAHITCYHCQEKGHYKSECPKFKKHLNFLEAASSVHEEPQNEDQVEGDF
jgi:hypothetical protein